MTPIIGSGAFTSTQIIDWRVDWFDSSMDVPERGIGFRLGNPASTFTTAGMQAAANPTSYYNTNTTPVLTNSGTWGSSPIVVDYWGSGAPTGISKARFVAFHYRGFVATDRSWIHKTGTTSSAWLSFSGNGYIRVQLNGADILNTKLSYSTFVTSTLFTPVANDRIDIYYFQLGDPWGGLVGKYVAQKTGQSSATTDITIDQYRESPPLAASIIPFTTATSTTLKEVIEAAVEINGPLDTAMLKFRVPLSNQDSSSGWRLLTTPRRLQYTSTSGVVSTLKRKQLIKFFGGFQSEQYSRFTGHIVNFNEQNSIIEVECAAVEDRMAKVPVENYPDPISYCTFGYFKQASTFEPIFNITAYDNWPLEHAIKDLSYKAGIDSKLFYGIRQTNNINGNITDIQDEIGNKHYLTRSKSISGSLLKLQRPLFYGNSGAGFDSRKPADDQYIYRPNLSNSVLDWARELADSLGYDFRSNADGNIVLASRNNAHRYSKTTGIGTQKFSPSAIQGTYQEMTGPFTKDITLNGGRFDLVVGRESTLGTINYSVQVMSGIQVASGTLDLALVGETSGIFFYDNRFTIRGNNQAIFTLYTGKWGTYSIHLAQNTGTKWWLDSILIYDYDSQKSTLPQTLVTDFGVETLRTESNAQEAVNRVVVIGKRKATITDSAKERNPNNPQNEFYVAAGADPSSIWDSTADNYVGGKIATLIVDNKISDQDYADWAALTLLTRQRDPGPSADITHPILPFLEPRDPISIGDQNYNSITGSNLVWITRITESYAASSSESTLSTTSYSQLPSYDPRQDLDVATIDSVFFGQPAINISISYPSIDSGTVTNPGPNLTNAKLWGYMGSGTSYILKEERLATYGSDSNGTFISMSGTAAWPPIPDSITLGPDDTTVSPTNVIYRSRDYRTLRNNPYMKFTHIYDYATKKIHLPCQAADGTAPYQLAGWRMGTSAHLAYFGLDSSLTPTTVYSGRAPFYDPYISELPDGNFVTISFDALTSGYYRVSVWDARNTNSPTLVAWLTEPSNESPEPDSHWAYMTSGKNKQFLWDGVDTVGDWNKKQSEDYSWIARGWFGIDQRPEIGKGFYVWNDNTTQAVTISGQMLGNKLVFNPDNYSQFYIKIEVYNDLFATTAEQSPSYQGFSNYKFDINTIRGIPKTPSTSSPVFISNSTIRTINSTQLKGVTAGQNAAPSIYIYTYLSPPTKAIISNIEDWTPSVKAYNPVDDAYGTVGWTVLSSGTGDYAATFRNDKPIRLSFQAIARPGGRFSGNSQFTTFKVHRITHLNAGIMDLFFLLEGEPWHALSPVEKKRIVSRRLTNAQHTLDFADTDYRTGDTLTQSQNKWVFRPSDFKIENGGQNQSIEYCNYLQLEDVPGFSQLRTLGEQKSRLLLAYMNYIFYLSVFIQDRSGRFTWMIDPTDVDYSKILYNQFKVEFPEDLENYSTRTIVARQWNDPNYIQSFAQTWNIVSGTNAYNYIQFFHNRLNRTDADAAKALRLDTNSNTVTGFLTTGFTDPYSVNHLNDMEITGYLTNKQLGNWSSGTLTNFFGDWTWEGYTGDTTVTAPESNPLWIPDLTRDFHPFILCPPMGQHSLLSFANFPSLDITFVTPVYTFVTRDTTGAFDGGPDQSAWDTWFSPTYVITNTNANKRRFKPGHQAQEGMIATTVVKEDLINYQKQIEHLHWEEYRGFISTGKRPSRNPILVMPGGGPYLQNLYAYNLMRRQSRIQLIPGSTSSTISPLQGEYKIRVRIPTDAGSVDGLFQWTFRSKYTWYSSSYFPINEYGMLQPKFLYPKYSVTNWGTAEAYDAGAWVGWKDDLAITDVPFHWIDALNGEPFGTTVVSSTLNNNIFINSKAAGSREKDRPPFALARRFAVSKDCMISLSLVNSRRMRPLAGK